MVAEQYGEKSERGPMEQITHEDIIQKKIDTILEWALDNPEFETGFIDRINEVFQERGVITPRQEEAIDNILEKWDIEVD